ncbi:hypothetical protein SteCoe_8990 [Stentor coeruleus]|uniref:DOP1 N-terminal domain-containing protein n=1 Tax=Stentor coeruleus TaxID=5963 RepID=A0A1R2CIZ5_9CILI|nr:hypothetical protein SteCoe_8990 [Stentor coeruleus]
MDYNLSERKITQILDKLRAKVQKSEKDSEYSSYLTKILIIYLNRLAQPSQTSKLLCDLPFFIDIHPLRYLISLGPYFAQGHLGDKKKLLEIMKNHYYSNEKKLNISIFALVINSFRAISECNEISTEVVQSIDNLSRITRVHECVWKVVLKSPKARLPALNYLHYRLVVDNKNRAFHALLCCLDDQSLQVKRCALDLLKRVFSFNSPDVDKSYKLAILRKIFGLVIVGDRPIISKINEWLAPNQEKSFNSQAVEIISEALLLMIEGQDIDNKVVIISNFIYNSDFGREILKRVLIPLAIYDYSGYQPASESISSLIKSHEMLFWQQFLQYFNQAFKEGFDKKPLYRVLEHALIRIKYQHTTIDKLILILFKHADEDPEVYINYAINLLQYIDKTSITNLDLLDLKLTLGEHWKLYAKLLLRFAKLGLSCKELIEDLLEEYKENYHDLIEVINISLVYNPKALTIKNIKFVLKYSMLNNTSETIEKLIKIIPDQVNSLLETLLTIKPINGIKYLIYIQNLQLEFSSGLLIKASELFSYDDSEIKYLAIMWLNKVYACNSDIFSSFINSLEVKSKLPQYLQDCSRILQSLKELLKHGGEMVLKLLIHYYPTRFFAIIEQLLIKPPPYYSILKLLAYEVVCEIVKFSSIEMSAHLIDISMAALIQAIKLEDCTLLLILKQLLENNLNVLDYEAHNEINSRGLINIQEPLVKLIIFEDKIVRNAWLDFIDKLVPFIIEHLDESTSISYINAFLKRYFLAFNENHDKKILEAIWSLTKHVILQKDYCYDKNRKKLVYNSLQKYLDTVVLSIGTSTENISYEIISLLKSYNEYKFVKSFVYIWTEYCPYDKNYWLMLDKYLEIFPIINLDLVNVFTQLNGFLHKNLEIFNTENEEKILSIGSLIYKLHEKLEKPTNGRIWNEAIEIYKSLIKSHSVEIRVFVIYSINALVESLGSKSLNLLQKIEMKKMVKEVVGKTFANMRIKKDAIQMPYPYVLVDEKPTISQIYTVVIKNCIHNIIDIGD